MKKIVKSIYFDGQINTESITNVQNEISDVFEDKDGFFKPCWVNLYLNSEGGDIAAAEVFLDFLEEYKDSITLIGSGHIASAGLLLYLSYTGYKKVLPMCYGLAHTYTSFIEIRGSNKKSNFNTGLVKMLTNHNKTTNELILPLLSIQDVEDLHADLDVFIPYEKLKKLNNLPPEELKHIDDALFTDNLVPTQFQLPPNATISYV